MANPWEMDWSAPEVSAVPLPRNPDAVAAERRDNDREDRSEGRANRTEARDVANTAFSQSQSLRKEYQALPSVAEYRTSLGTYSSALKTRANAQGDQSLITAYAKMLDPNSVVREGEFAVTASTESTLNQIKSRLAKEFGWKEGGMLTASGRDAVKTEMLNLVLNRFKPAYDRDRRQFQRYAQMEGFDPYLIVGEDAATGFDPQLLDPIAAPEAEQTLAAPGSQTVQGQAIPPEYQQAHYNYLRMNWGNIDPERYAAFRSELDQQYGLTPDPEAYQGAVAGFNDLAAQGGSPAQLGAVPNPQVEPGFWESAMNTAAQHPIGAFAANMGNAGAFGLPGAAAGQDKLELLRAQSPIASGLGEVAGSISGTMLGGAGLGAVKALGSKAPLAADLAHGSLYGATQDTENLYRGAAYGVLGAGAGSLAGRALGAAFPGAVKPVALSRAESAVPDSERGRDIASQLYDKAETSGTPAGPTDTQDLYQRLDRVLRAEGRIAPDGQMIDVDSPTARAFKLVKGFDGQAMTPRQAGNVRHVVSEGRAGPDAEQARLARIMTDEFDQWADPVLPGVSDARQAAERYIQGDIVQEARELAESDATRKFSQSGLENSIRSRFGALDRAMINGTERFGIEAADSIRETARGNVAANLARNLGKLAPTSPWAAAVGPLALGASAGATSGSPLLGTAVALGSAAAGGAGRAIATHQASRHAKLAELFARDPKYKAVLDDIRKEAGTRAGHIGAGLFGSSSSLATR